MLILCVFMSCIIVCGCGSEIEKVEDETVEKTKDIKMHKISDTLWYDEDTYIVYLWNGVSSTTSNVATMPSAYMAPNGLPFRWNTAKKELEQLDWSEVSNTDTE